MNARSHENLNLWRHLNAAADAAALLAALTRYRVTDREAMHALTTRQEYQLLDLLHTFAYNARRSIELADEYDGGLRDRAANFSLPGIGESEIQLGIGEDAVPLTDQSLWWVLGRIIHSRELRVHALEDAEVGNRGRVSMYQTPVAFSVRSDHDKPGIVHFAKIERLLEAFLLLTGRFENALKAAGFELHLYR